MAKYMQDPWVLTDAEEPQSLPGMWGLVVMGFRKAFCFALVRSAVTMRGLYTPEKE